MVRDGAREQQRPRDRGYAQLRGAQEAGEGVTPSATLVRAAGINRRPVRQIQRDLLFFGEENGFAVLGHLLQLGCACRIQRRVGLGCFDGFVQKLDE